jgi:hypothetical protein
LGVSATIVYVFGMLVGLDKETIGDATDRFKTKF